MKLDKEDFPHPSTGYFGEYVLDQATGNVDSAHSQNSFPNVPTYYALGDDQTSHVQTKWPWVSIESELDPPTL
jgi:hypothetical protein